MPEDTTPDDLSPEYLAAYADGELDAETHATVERWLAENPDALPTLDAQRAFGPNAGLWERAEVPEPSPAAWASARREIESRLNPAAPKPGYGRQFAGWVLGGIATAAAAAAVAWIAFGPVAEQRAIDGARLRVDVAKAQVAPPPRLVVASLKPDLLAEFAVLPMATDDEVTLDRVPDTRSGWLPTGRHPLGDTLALASFEEVHLEEVDLSPVWPAGGPKMKTAPGHAPMIFAAKPR
ncbi:MAG: hypothetical protein C0467_06210 [Planctomycetaceae bacterium]|nr:hypothetical protein [Planctomycetaceae bacterium]